MVAEVGELLANQMELSRRLATSIRNEKQSRLPIQFQSFREVLRFIFWHCFPDCRLIQSTMGLVYVGAGVYMMRKCSINPAIHCGLTVPPGLDHVSIML